MPECAFSDGIIEIGAVWRHQFVFECDRIGDHIQPYPIKMAQVPSLGIIDSIKTNYTLEDLRHICAQCHPGTERFGEG